MYSVSTDFLNFGYRVLLKALFWICRFNHNDGLLIVGILEILIKCDYLILG